MKTNKKSISGKHFRQLLTNEAARLMYEENVKQYHTAKWRAAKNILSQGGGKTSTVRTRDLPSNGEISEQVYQLASMYEGRTLTDRLFEMRLLALEVMATLEEFSPRLIGSVSTGRIKKGSDIDLHVFTDTVEKLEFKLNQLKWQYEKECVDIRYKNGIRQFTHFYLHSEYPVELSVYPENDIRIQGRSSTDGKPIIRISYNRLLDLIQTEHADEWEIYISESEGVQL